MNNTELANDLLFTDPETGEELRPIPAAFTTDAHHRLVLVVSNKDGSRTWKHTIMTEEV